MTIYETTSKGLGVSEMLKTLIDKTWKSSRLTGIQGLIQLQTEQVLLTYLLAASVNDNNSFATKATIKKSLADLKSFIDSKNNLPQDEIYKGHLILALDRMKEPAAAKPTLHKEIPPGAPIGCDWDD
jgi:hypothetical protein